MRRQNANKQTGHVGRARSPNRRPTPNRAAKSITGLVVAILLVGTAVFGEAGESGNHPAVDTTEFSSISKRPGSNATALLTAPAKPMHICGSGRRSTCIVDGDTFWLAGVKYRIANIDTPELKGNCGAEQVAARHARDRLKQLMSAGPIALNVTGTDRFGRTLVLVSASDGDVGERLVSEGLAEVWGGAFINWCSG